MPKAPAFEILELGKLNETEKPPHVKESCHISYLLPESDLQRINEFCGALIAAGGLLRRWFILLHNPPPDFCLVFFQTRLTNFFLAISRGPITPFITIVGAHPVGIPVPPSCVPRRDQNQFWLKALDCLDFEQIRRGFQDSAGKSKKFQPEFQRNSSNFPFTELLVLGVSFV